ncbi:MAG: protein adenylyltransferase SelO [Salibacteraceae bacterium]
MKEANSRFKTFTEIPHSPRFSKELPKDKNLENSSRQVFGACFSNVTTQTPQSPGFVHVSLALSNELGIEVDDKALDVLSGNKPFHNADAYAMCYGGHQFGSWAGQLGDGRATNIAELDLNGQNWKFQLKGAGPTPYSRNSDGLAVLRSSIREYLCSEAMHHLGVRTTRALSLIKTGNWVTRDILYNGNPKDEHGAIVCRVSPSFIRFGNFQIFASRGELDELKTLVNYTIKHHFPQLGAPSKDSYLAFFKEVCKRTKSMIVNWQRVGFVHGVMNTDNMSILGQTIDYGPYGWLENYDPSWTPNTTDAQNRRYQFGNQASISLWNLTQLANALYPIIEDVESLQSILDEYKTEYLAEYHFMMLSKLGLSKKTIEPSFVQELQDLLEKSEIDMTLFFRLISSDIKLSESSALEILVTSSYLEKEEMTALFINWNEWLNTYMHHIAQEKFSLTERSIKMKKENPKYVLRNYMAQLAIDDADKGDYTLIDELYTLLLTPYNEQPEMEKWFAKRPSWADHKVGCSMLSCSS